MQLRHHPLMWYCGFHGWPPPWISSKGMVRVNGEVGILRDVAMKPELSPNNFFLGIDYEGTRYVGCVAVDDPTFCRQVFLLLQHHCGETIKEVGDLELSHTL